MFSYPVTIEGQIKLLEATNDDLAKRLRNSNWTASKDVPLIAECITKNVQVIANLAKELREYLNPSPVVAGVAKANARAAKGSKRQKESADAN